MDLAVDQEFAKLVEEVCHYFHVVLYTITYADSTVLQRQEASLGSLSRPSCPRSRQAIRR